MSLAAAQATISAEPLQQQSPVKTLTAMVRSEFDEVNRLIVAHMHSSVPLIPELAGYLVASGGKRVRPLLTLAAARLCGYEGTRQCGLAAAVEFIHTATLLHDDVVDQSDLRRGRDTANAVWGNEASVLVGDFLFSRAFQLMVADGSLPVLKLLSDASAIIAEGEVMQLTTANNIDCTVAEYLQVIEAKTGALFSAACRVGGEVAEVSEAQKQALFDFGAHLGMAFQIIDDLLDYAATDKDMGKTQGDDFQDGKMTLPVIIAIERGSPDERAFWQRTMGEQQIEAGDMETALGLIEKYDALSATHDAAQDYVEKAKTKLALFPDSDVKRELERLADFVVTRGY